MASTGGVVFRPQLTPFSAKEIAAIAAVIIVVALVSAGAGSDFSFDMSRVFDAFVRHQAVVFSLAGVAIGALLFWGSVRRHPEQFTRLSFGALPVALPGLGSIVLGALIGMASPVPDDTWLDLPPAIRDEAQNQKLIIFIHGWNGDAADTWQQFPALVIGDPRLAAYNVLSIDYPNFMFRRQLSVAGLAAFFVRAFDDHHVFERYEKVVVIAHSMGGLVAREMVFMEGNNTPRKAFSQLIEIAVPHLGSNVAKLASALGLSKDQTADMATGSIYLRDMRTRWAAPGGRPPTFCITSPQDIVVPSSSAITDCLGSRSYMQGSHTEIVKPPNRSDMRYTYPTDEIK